MINHDYRNHISTASVLVVDNDKKIGALFQAEIGNGCSLLSSATSTQDAEHELARNYFDMIVIAVQDVAVIDWLADIRAKGFTGGALLVADIGDLNAISTKIDYGLDDLVSKPLDAGSLRVVLMRNLYKRQLQTENRLLRKQSDQQFQSSGLLGVSQSMLVPG